MLTTVYLVRHSEKMRMPRWPDHTYCDRIQPLNVNGERKAKGLLELEEMRGADAALCSPFARTLSTLRYVTEADHVPVSMDEDLKELEFGKRPDFEGPMGPEGMPPEGGPGPGKGPKHGPDSFEAKQWEDRDIAREGGESLNQAAARMGRAIGKFVSENQGKKLLVGSHGAAICAYLSQFMPEIGDDYTRELTQPAVFRMTFDGENVKEIERLALPPEACNLEP